MLANRFFKMGVIYMLAGMSLGLAMGMSGDHSQFPAHTHINLLGFVCMMIFGFYYRMNADTSGTKLATANFWLSNIGVIGLFPSLMLIYSGRPEFEPAAGIFSIVAFAGALCFALNVLRSSDKA